MLLPWSWRQRSHEHVTVHLFAIAKLLSTVPRLHIFSNIYRAENLKFALCKKKQKKQTSCATCAILPKETNKKSAKKKTVLLTHKWCWKSGKVVWVKPRLVANVLTCNSELCDGWRCFISLWFLKRKKIIIKKCFRLSSMKKKKIYHYHRPIINVAGCVCAF